MVGCRTYRFMVCAVSVTTLLLSGGPTAPVAFAASGSIHPGPSDPSSAASTRTSSSGDGTARSVPSIATTPDPTIVQMAEQGVAQAAADGVTQSVAVVDRSTGALVADVGGRQIYHTESLTKLFTAAYYLERAEGTPDAELTDRLSRMIAMSDDGIQSSLWRADIVPTVAARYGLTGSSDPTDANGGDWGSDRTTADDMVTYLLRASQDPWVGPSVLGWMAATQPTGADGFDQDFGLFGLTGDRGVKQGWSDPDWQPRNVHSVGWTDRYFIAILQTSPTASFATMRATSTATAQLLAGPGAPATSAPAVVSAPAASPSASPSAGPPADPATTTGSAGDLPGTDALVELGRSVADIVKQGLLDVFRP